MKNLNFDSSEILEKEQLKFIFGGNVGCLQYCGDTGTWLWENSSMTDQEVSDWYDACNESCENG